ncbi:hypothetical protein FACS189475_07900 [Betaproteobacteria bacterium]|nr:hypothetical protein FACS189475_07900 [Betaproteobacteria bacterium]
MPDFNNPVEKKGFDMLPLFPFVAGLLTGAAATKLLRDKKVKIQLDKAQGRLREASVSGLNTIEQSVAYLRDRIQATTPATDSADSADSDVATSKANADKPLRKLPAKSKTVKATKASTASARGNK